MGNMEEIRRDNFFIRSMRPSLLEKSSVSQTKRMRLFGGNPECGLVLKVLSYCWDVREDSLPGSCQLEVHVRPMPQIGSSLLSKERDLAPTYPATFSPLAVGPEPLYQVYSTHAQ